MSMTDNELRVAIAEACGYKPTSHKTFAGNPIFEKDGERYAISHALIDCCHFLPDYPNDLNAMADAEKALTDDQYYTYTGLLDTFAGRAGAKTVNEYARATVSATACQRALAFVQTIAAPPQVPEGGQEGQG